MIEGEYVDQTSNLTWECNKGHVWTTKGSYVLSRDAWCLKCVFEQKKLVISDIRKLAEKKGGKLISKEYTDNRTPLKWKCDEKHSWFATLNSVKGSNSWCPECANERKGIRGLKQAKK